ncbi:MAG: response regulator [Candidatus Magasanikbacteria bacterium]|jgi:two-component system, chemotaxis family, chemotaxis protein CheY|nr:response regulator [Candidatus Magasanikbacteria bacterium]
MAKDQLILLTDDSAFMRGVLKNILTEAGHTQFLEASNGKEALEIIKANSPALVLLDVIMPEMGGMDVLKEVGSTTNIVMVTAVGQDTTTEEAKSLGAKGYIVKPFEKAQVLEAVNAVLGE